MQRKVLIVTQDPEMLRLKEHGEWNDYNFMIVFAGRSGSIPIHDREQLSLCILDLDYPEQEVRDILPKLNLDRHIPVEIMSRQLLPKRMWGIPCYLKPQTWNECFRHIRERLLQAEMRQAYREAEILRIGSLTVNRKSCQTFISGQEVHLPIKEFLLLSFMIENRNAILTREEMYKAVWKRGDYIDPGILTVHINNIRRKLGPCKQYIRTVWGVGYQFYA